MLDYEALTKIKTVPNMKLCRFVYEVTIQFSTVKK
jgi:hypothetical protein